MRTTLTRLRLEMSFAAKPETTSTAASATPSASNPNEFSTIVPGRNVECARNVREIFRRVKSGFCIRSIKKVRLGFLLREKHFVKQSYHLEDIRLLTLRGVKNMASIVLAAIYFGSVWLGRRVKCSVIFRSVIDMSQRMGQLGGFLYYALASGLKRAFARGGGWKGLLPEETEVEDRQMLLNLDLTG